MDSHFYDFSKYLAARLPNISVRLAIKKSRFTPGILSVAPINGIESVLNAYQWKSSWADQSGSHASQDWSSTKESLGTLRHQLRDAVFGGNATDDDAFIVTLRILEWGGDRNRNNGATPFLRELKDEKALKKYLRDCARAFDLSESNVSALSVVRKMNAMLTKIHALLATDGLPIYDSRVAAAIATLAEQYRQDVGLNYMPDSIKFPTVDGNHKSVRHVAKIYPEAVDPYQLRYAATHKQPPEQQLPWAVANWKAGKLMRLILKNNPSLLSAEGDVPARCHALEAVFFMIGYDPACLLPKNATA